MPGGFANFALSLLFSFALPDLAAGAERATNDLEHAYIALALDME